MNQQITELQLAVLDLISMGNELEGKTPSLKEIAKLMNAKNSSSPAAHLKALVKKNLVIVPEITIILTEDGRKVLEAIK